MLPSSLYTRFTFVLSFVNIAEVNFCVFVRVTSVVSAAGLTACSCCTASALPSANTICAPTGCASIAAVSATASNCVLFFLFILFPFLYSLTSMHLYNAYNIYIISYTYLLRHQHFLSFFNDSIFLHKFNSLISNLHGICRSVIPSCHCLFTVF